MLFIGRFSFSPQPIIEKILLLHILISQEVKLSVTESEYRCSIFITVWQRVLNLSLK